MKKILEKKTYYLKPLEWKVTDDSEELKSGRTTNGLFKYYYYWTDEKEDIYKKYRLRFFKCPENSVSLLIGRFDTLKELKEAAQLIYEKWMIDNFIEIKE